MRCSCGTTARIASLGLNCFLAGRSDACGVCVELQAFCIFGLHLKDLNSLNLVLGTKLVQNSDLVFSPRSKFSLKD